MTACAPEKKRASWGRKLLILLAVALLLLWFMQQNLNQVVLSMAYANAQALTVSVLNQAVQEVLATGVSYDDMMIVQKDDAGRVSLLQANTTLMNSLASETALHAQAALSSLENQFVSIPLGAALGVTILAGSGPRIRCRSCPWAPYPLCFPQSFNPRASTRRGTKFCSPWKPPFAWSFPTAWRRWPSVPRWP